MKSAKPKPLKEKVSITLDGDIIEILHRLSAEDDRSLSSTINLILRNIFVKTICRSTRNEPTNNGAPEFRGAVLLQAGSAGPVGAAPSGSCTRPFYSVSPVHRMRSSFSCFASTTSGAPLISSLAFCTFGNAITSRMESFFIISITSRSRP